MFPAAMPFGRWGGFGLDMLGREVQRRGIGAQQAGIDDALGPGLSGGLDHVVMLGCTLADLVTGNQQQRKRWPSSFGQCILVSMQLRR